MMATFLSLWTQRNKQNIVAENGRRWRGSLSYHALNETLLHLGRGADLCAYVCCSCYLFVQSAKRNRLPACPRTLAVLHGKLLGRSANASGHTQLSKARTRNAFVSWRGISKTPFVQSCDQGVRGS